MPKSGYEMNYSKKTIEERKADGTYRPDRHDFHGIEADNVTDHRPPAGLDSVAKKYWKKNIDRLAANGLLKESDLATFELCCIAYSDFQKWEKRSQTLAGADLDEVIRIQRQKNSQMKNYLEFAKALGLTAVDRGKVKAEAKQDADPWAEFINP